MAHQEVTLTRFTCDGCGRSIDVDVDLDGPPNGYHGQHSHIGSWGGTGGEWFACRRSCILKAMDKSEEK